VPRLPSAPPPTAKTATISYRVPFYDTDAMRVVHHARYVHYLELARIEYLDLHDRPYREYVAEGLHYAVTAVELRYQQAARYDDRLHVTCWLAWLKRVSLGIGYVVTRDGELIATATTEHALVSDDGKLVPIPRAPRRLAAALARGLLAARTHRRTMRAAMRRR
jgi:acyl-CoA thioester hydrolase